MTSILDKLRQLSYGSSNPRPLPPSESNTPAVNPPVIMCPTCKPPAVKREVVEPPVMNTGTFMPVDALAEDLIEIRIIVDNKKDNEYPAEAEIDDRSGKDILTKYVEVVSGAQFSFKPNISPRYRFGREEVLTMRVWIDGQYCGGKLQSQMWHSVVIGSTLVI